MAAFKAIPGVAEVTALKGKENDMTLEVRPAKNAAPATAIASLIKKNDWPVSKFLIERGRLDKVFRQLTIGERPAA